MRRPSICLIALNSRWAFVLAVPVFLAVACERPLSPSSPGGVLETPPSPAFGETVVVEASWYVARGPIDPMSLRRLLAWREGHLIIPDSAHTELYIEVTHVVEGQLPEYDPARPVVPVLVLNSAALAFDYERRDKISGRWTLRRLPGGALGATEAKDIPVEVQVDEGEILAELEQGLSSTFAVSVNLMLPKRGCPAEDLVPGAVVL